MSNKIHVVKNRFCKNRSLLRQIFCKHTWERRREVAPEFGLETYYEQCPKCGKLKEIYYYEWSGR